MKGFPLDAVEQGGGRDRVKPSDRFEGVLTQVFPHDDRGRDADVQALNLPELGDGQGSDIGVGCDIGADAEFFMAQNEGAVFWKGGFGKGRAFHRIQREKGVTAPGEILVAGFKTFMKTGRHPFKGSHGRGRIEKVNPHQVDFTGTEGIGTAEDLADIEGGLQSIQNDGKRVDSRRCQAIGISLTSEPLLRRHSSLLNAAPDLSKSQWVPSPQNALLCGRPGSSRGCG